MSTDTDNELRGWAEMADDALAELSQLRVDIATRGLKDPIFAAVMTGVLIKVIRSANADIWESIDGYAEGPSYVRRLTQGYPQRG